MSTVAQGQDDDAERDADAQADAMKAQLRKDVASWSKARGEASPRIAAEPSAPAVRQPSAKPVARPRNTKPAAPVATPAGSSSKPYRMSYDGGTTADYIQYMIDRGAK
jgi:hypothetical protein